VAVILKDVFKAELVGFYWVFVLGLNSGVFKGQLDSFSGFWWVSSY